MFKKQGDAYIINRIYSDKETIDDEETRKALNKAKEEFESNVEDADKSEEEDAK